MSRTDKFVLWSDEAVAESYSADTIAAMCRQYGLADRVGTDGSGSAPGVLAKHRLNVRPDPIDHRDLHYVPTLVEVKPFLFADAVRNKDFHVRRQGAEGSCTGQALAAVVDLQNVKRYQLGARVPKRVSARMAYESAKIYDAFPDDGLQGSSARGAIKGFYHRGICDARMAPYFDGEIGWSFDKEIAADARAVVLGAYFRLHHVLNHYHTAISEVGAIFCSAMIHDGWEKEAVASNGGRIKLPGGATGRTKLRGAHAFAIVGYDDEGFLVLNSWGRDWGGFDPQAAHRAALAEARKKAGASPATAEDAGGPLPGVAHWSYDDWSEHVLDAWVLRLTAPTRRNASYSGGYYAQQKSPDTAAAARAGDTPRSRNVLGHYIHVRDGRLVHEPPYDNTSQTFKQTAAIIRAKDKKSDPVKRYKHLLFYAHGGLNTIEAASARAAAMIGTFKRHQVYPVFYFWRTGFGNMIQEILAGMAPKIEARVAGNKHVVDHIIERLLEPVGKAIWDDIRSNAESCFSTRDKADCPNCRDLDGETCRCGQAWTETSKLISAARDDVVDGAGKVTDRCRHPLKIHYISHSAGVFMLGEFLRRMQREHPDDLVRNVHSVTLLAPACTTTYFRDTFGPLVKALPRGRLRVYNLPDTWDRFADQSYPPYGKSLLYLVSNVFERVRNAPIAGLDKFWDQEFAQKAAADGKAKPADPLVAAICRKVDYNVLSDEDFPEAFGHAGFDNSAEIMNRILSDITGTPVDRLRDGVGFRDENLRDGRF